MVAVVVIVAGAGDNDGAQAVWLAMVAIRRGLWLSEHWPEWPCASAMSPRACVCHDYVNTTLQGHNINTL